MYDSKSYIVTHNTEYSVHKYRVYHIEMDETKWLWGVEGSIILLNYGA